MTNNMRKMQINLQVKCGSLPLNSILANFSPLHLGIWNCLSLTEIDMAEYARNTRRRDAPDATRFTC